MLRALHILAWAPFALAVNRKALVAIFIAGCIITQTPFNFPLFFLLAIIYGAALPTESRLRPFFPPKRRLGLPPQQTGVLPSLARIAVRVKGRAPKVARIDRQLAPELRQLLISPLDRQPEAVAHERRQALQVVE